MRGSCLRGPARNRRLRAMRVSRPRRALTPQEIAARVKAEATLAANAPRDAKIAALRTEGRTLAEIGALVNLSRQRVHTILKRLDGASAA